MPLLRERELGKTYKYPRSVRFLDRWPRTETGKLQRFKLRSGDPD
jgi:acyl-coenzyme A synthetase/AMP-(fatty) acid ligase